MRLSNHGLTFMGWNAIASLAFGSGFIPACIMRDRTYYKDGHLHWVMVCYS